MKLGYYFTGKSQNTLALGMQKSSGFFLKKNSENKSEFFTAT
jgi:hypothetical protein